MKPINAYLLKSAGFLLLLFVLSGCLDKPGLWKNDQIPPGQRGDFHQLNDQALQYFKANDAKGLGRLLSEELIESPSTTKRVELIGNRVQDFKFELLDEYYIIKKSKTSDTLKITDKGVNNCTLIYPAKNREMYVAFFAPKTGANKYIVTLIYEKYSYGWKISDMAVSPYTINGKTGPELYQLAKAEYGKNYLFDANSNMALATTCLKPISFWQYNNEEEIHNFYGKITAENNKKYRFPYTLTQLPTRPMVLGVYTKTTDDGTFPLIYYMSHIDIKDTTEIKKENVQVKSVLAKLLPGIDKDKKYIYYNAFNKFPSGMESVDRFDMTDKLQ